ncbi:SpoIIE family protein phosphatase [Streptomyces echinatus]|uniref:protein-serine/threonine phosphatase n=1 Tax=Streptomyces echinatus TaxID=67293 RepID=A0A7W9Q0T5_9ACTN|nr:SpoIIE family protein phosphatase [Streptomyces echinatus]MBB5931520.1 serine phosphatase RsbU (regulator of sigma subunit)/PAS domain-containing protein [Streptomyces echinatus]
MAGSDEAVRTRDRLAALLVDASTSALGAAGGRVAGVYLRSGTPGLLRLSVLAGLPGPLFRPWWRLHVDRPFPVADAYRLGVQVILPNATETMRRYPQFAAGLPFPFGSVHVPVPGGTEPLGVLSVLRPAVTDTVDELLDREPLARLAEGLGAELLALADGDESAVFWDGEPMCVRPPPDRPAQAAAGRFSWDPVTSVVCADDRLHALLGLRPGEFAGTDAALAQAVAPADAHRILAALREAAAGKPPNAPLVLRAGDGTQRLMDLWPEGAGDDESPVAGVIFHPGPAASADGAADLLPQGVFCLDRLGQIVYANPAMARLTGRAQEWLLGRELWDALPWLGGPPYDDHLRGALLAPDSVHFHVQRPAGERDGAGEGDWLAVSVHPGTDLLTFTLAPASRMDTTAEPVPVPRASGDTVVGDRSLAPLYRPIALAIALTDAVTARQVSAVVMQELLPAFGGRRLAIYLLQDRHLYLAWENGFPQGFLAPFDGVGLDAPIPGVETLTTGRPLFFESMEQLAAAYPGLALDADVGARAFLPLIASGRPVGSCILGFDRPRGFSTEERTVLTALAGLIAQAMERARRYDSEAALARGLQQALLPRRLSAHPQVETAGRYLPGTQGMDVGGDWYDVVEAGDGLALVIGDVQGHGVQAAATMGQLRSAVRAFALGDRPPDEVLSGTNHLLIDLDPGQFASCCYLRLDPATGRARIARAGHPPPLLRCPDGRTRVLDIAGGVVLGVDPHARYPVTELPLEPDAILALYTDGLVERPGTDIDDGITALRLALAKAGAAACRRGGRTLAAVADRLTATARLATDRPDDVALLLAARRAAASRDGRRSHCARGPAAAHRS